MKEYIDSPIYQILCNIFDLVILNLIFMLCCLPIVTIGAATSALYNAVFHMHRGEGFSIKDFFCVFRTSMRTGIPLWLIWIVAFSILCADFGIISLFWDFPGRFPLLGILALGILVLILWGSCLFAILSLYSSGKAAMKSAFLSCFQYLPRMIPVCFFNLLPALLLLFWPYGFLLISAFFLLIWFSLTAYINFIFLRPVMRQAESLG